MTREDRDAMRQRAIASGTPQVLDPDLTYRNGSVRVLTKDRCGIRAIRNCPCPDGRRRYAEVMGQIPVAANCLTARVRHWGQRRWISGQVELVTQDGADHGWVFIPNNGDTIGGH